MIDRIIRPLPSIIATLLILFLGRVFGQDEFYHPDPTFNPWDIGYGHADGPQQLIYDHYVDPQGRIYIVGNFLEVNGKARKYIARLHADGTLDEDFDVGIGPNSTCYSVHVQSNGRILVGGSFFTFNGSSRLGIVGLMEDGSVDATWPTEVSGYQVSVIVEQPDGKIMIGGAFSNVNGTSRKCIARLEADGTVDPEFTTPGSFYSTGNDTPNVSGIRLLPDGKILMNGMFDAYGGVISRCLARLHPTGAIDNTFSTGQGFTSTETIGTTSVKDVALMPGGSMMVVGRFQFYNGVARSGVAKLSADGTLDPDHDPGSGSSFANYANGPSTVIHLSNGNCIIAGDIEIFNGTGVGNILRLLPDGSIDAGFQCGDGTNGTIWDMTLMGDDILLTGWFDRYDHKGFNKIAKIDVDGVLMETFAAPGTGFNRIGTIDIPVSALIRKTDGRIMAAGSFTTYNGNFRNGLVQMDPDGNIDPLHSVGIGFDQPVYALAELPDGRIVAGGWFSEYDGSVANKIMLLHADGSIDTSFNAGDGPNNKVNTVAVQPDGKILIGGYFYQFSGQTCWRITRLLQNGSIDPTWNVNSPSSTVNGFNGEVNTILVQDDGQIIVGGDFTSYNLQPVPMIARLLPSGDLDPTFDPAAGFNAPVKTLRTTSDGKILVGGEFTYFNGSPALYLARLNNDGSRDMTFTLPGIDDQVRSIAIGDDGSIFIGGEFQNVDWLPRGGVAQLNEDGSLRTDVSFGSGFNGQVSSIFLEDQAMIIAAGSFTTYNGVGRNRIARLRLDDITMVDAWETGSARIGIHPNPALSNSSIRLEIPRNDGSDRMYDVKVITSTGKLLFQRSIGIDDPVFDMAGSPPGIHQIVVENGGTRFMARLVILRSE